jgi:hypothetical protein
MKTFTCIVLLFLMSIRSFAQFGEIRGIITDKTTGQPLPGATVSWKVNDVLKGTISNEKGEYIIKPLIPGSYDIEFSYVMYHKQLYQAIQVNAEKATYVDAVLSPNNTLPPIVIKWEPPLIEKDNVITMEVFTETEIEQSVERDVLGFVALSANTVQRKEGGAINIRGSRSDNTIYIVDGIKMTGPFSLPKSAIEEISVLTGGIPAQFGDATGGIVIITTKGYK